MQKYSNLSLGEKLKQIRVAKRLSQENVAKGVNTSESTVSRIEQGQTECSMEMLTAIKDYIGVAGAPLLEDELAAYESQLWVLNELVAARRITDAKAMQKKMFPIRELNFEQDLSILYSMIEARLMSIEGNLDGAEIHLNDVKNIIKDASIENQHLFHRNIGFLAFFRGDLKISLGHFLQVLDLQTDTLKPDASIYHNIGCIYRYLGQPFHALRYLEQALWKFDGDRTHMLRLYIVSALSECYAVVGEVDNAKKAAVETLMHVQSVNDEAGINYALGLNGFICRIMGNLEESLSFYSKCLLAFPKDSPEYVIFLCSKAIVLNEMKKRSQAKEVISEGKSLAKENEWLTIFLESIDHSMNLNNSKSVNYIENIAIPYLRASANNYKNSTVSYIISATYYKYMVIELCATL